MDLTSSDVEQYKEVCEALGITLDQFLLFEIISSLKEIQFDVNWTATKDTREAEMAQNLSEALRRPPQ
jgi:hypothetical protein